MIPKLTEEQEQFIAKCKDDDFDISQINQICHGFQENLSIEQVSVYAKLEFNWGQMEQIRWGFGYSKLTFEQVSLYAKKEFDYWQMCEIRHGFHGGLTFEQVSIYAKPEYKWEQMRKITKLLKKYKRISTIKTKVALMILES